MDTRITRTRFVVAARRALVGSAIVAGLALVPAATLVAGAEDDPCIAQGKCLVPGQPPAPTLVDSDLDGLTNSEELKYGLNPNNRDSDGDGLGDGDEFYNRFGYSYPNLFDSDGDGLGDGQEVNIYRTDPIRFDTDGDGVGDLAEINKGSNPRDASSK